MVARVRVYVYTVQQREPAVEANSKSGQGIRKPRVKSGTESRGSSEKGRGCAEKEKTRVTGPRVREIEREGKRESAR